MQTFFDKRTRYFDELDSIRKSNAQYARQLVNKAERLSHSEDWKATTVEMKNLQHEWKNVHPLPRDDAQNLWDQFNGAIQTFFQSKSQYYENKQREWESNKRR